jgi:hypothetical protein
MYSYLGDTSLELNDDYDKPRSSHETIADRFINLSSRANTGTEPRSWTNKNNTLK